MNDNIKISSIEQNISHINESLQRIESNMKSGFQEVNGRIDKINNRLWQLFFWVTGGFGAVLVVIAKANHWF